MFTLSMHSLSVPTGTSTRRSIGRHRRRVTVRGSSDRNEKREKTFTEKFEAFFKEEESIEEKEKRLNAQRKKELEMKNRVYDKDGTYVSDEGSDFFKDPEQLKAVVIFCAFLASFFSLGNIGAAFILPVIYGKPAQSCIVGILFGLPCPGIDY